MTEQLKSIFQIYINDFDDQIPVHLVPATESVKASFSSYNYCIYNLDSLRSFIRTEFNADVLHAFDKLKPYAYKADLGRYCLLYAFGGWYADITLKMLHTISNVPPDVHMIYFYDLGDGINPARSLFDVSNSLIYSQRHSPILLECIDMIVKNCASNYYGDTIYSPTGPSLFGSSIACHHAKFKFISGHLMQLTPSHKFKNTSFVLPDGQLVAQFKKGWLKHELISFGVQRGTNNYCDLWNNRDIYH